MPSAVVAAEGIRWDHPQRQVRSIPVTESTEVPAHRPKTTPEPWQSWGTTVRYLVIRLGLALPGVLLVWLASGCH